MNSNNTVNPDKKSLLRSIFLNLFVVIFIIIVYFYVSEVFGSISTFYIMENEFSISFGISLFIFTFFSILAGSISGFVSGFIAEFIYQIAFYNSIYIDWCILVAFFGFICGIYKYKPLKYQEEMKIYYIFLMLIISSFITMILIVVFQYFIYNSNLNIELIIINYGFKFLIQTLISIVFLIPIILIIYDKFFSSKERHLYYLLLTHHPISASDHTFYLEFGRTKIYFCSRCSGVIIGGLIAVFFTHLFTLIYKVEFSSELAVFLCIILPIPGLIDWGTQRLLLRKSTTESRLATGFIIGNALHFLSFTSKYFLFMIFLITIYFSFLFLLIYFGHKKEMKKLREEMEPLTSQVKESNTFEND